MGQQYSAPHFKTHARNIEHRCQLLTNKRNNEIRQWKKKIASLLSKGLDESARLETLQMLRYERNIVCYKLFTLAGRVLADSVGIVTKAQVCPLELMDSCCCIIFATDRFSEVSELKGVTEQLFAKFGEDWVQKVRLNKDKNVNPQLLRAMTDPNPIRDDMVVFLTQLGKEYNVDWTPREGFEAETLGCMKTFLPHRTDDGVTDIYIKLDEDDEEEEGGEEEVQEEEQPQIEEPPEYEPEPEPTPQPKQEETRGMYYYVDPNPPARYEPVAPAPTPEPTPAPTPAPVYQPVQPAPTPQPSPVAAYPALPPQQSPVAAYPSLPPQQSPISAYPALPPQQSPVAAYPALPQQQQHQQPQQSPGPEKDAATLALERRLAMLNAK